MSENPKIQTTASDELAGGQAPLTERRGNEASQSFPLSGRSGINVEMGSPRTFSPASNNREATSVSGMAVGGRLSEPAKHVDCRTIAGSTPGDSRNRPGDPAAASLARAADNGGPRNPAGQFANGRNCQTAPASKPFTGDSADADGGN